MTKAEITETKGCKKTLRVEIEKERFEDESKKALSKIKSEVQLPGFRKGKAPETMLLKRMGNHIRDEAVKDMIPKVLYEVFEEHGIKPVGEPEIDDLKFEESGSITFTVNVEEVLKIDISGLKGLKVTKEVRAVSDEDVDNYLERLKHMQAEQKEVEREARENDLLVVNLQKLDSSGVPIIGEKIEGHVISLDGQGTPSPEFDKQVIGMKIGETKKITYTYDESIQNPELVGTTEAYDVEILKVIEVVFPEMNDEFAKSLGGYENINDLREKTRENIASQNELDAGRKLQINLINEFIKKNPFEVPENMVERVMGSEYENMKKNAPDQVPDYETYKAQIRADAVRAVQSYLIVDAVKEESNIEVTKEEISDRLERIAEITKRPANIIRREMIKDGRYEGFANEIAQEKVFKWIEEVAHIKVETIEPKSTDSKIIKP
ncbi:trigger factor [Candidatus Latescibacterota bacterium]